MADELITLLEGRPVARLLRDKRGRLTFIYDEDWRADRSAYPLSLSLPLARREHGHEAIETFLWGLLPDNELVLDRWARSYKVSARSPFALLAHVGEDCAGAVQFLSLERATELNEIATHEIFWLDEPAIALRLRKLRTDHAAWRAEGDHGLFSLAGAQPKTALLRHHGRWGIPAGRVPTTHILKPPLGTFDGHAENEHFCLALAHALGLLSARSEVARFEDEVAIIIERYDRVEPNPRANAPQLVRVHQEDMCQALSVLPTRKYQNEGGPGPDAIVSLLRANSSAAGEDVRTFVDALTFNWLIAGTDAHAKNYSLLHGRGGRVRLAPLYDLASALPYSSLDQRRLKLAMKLGDSHSVRNIAARHFRKLAAALRLDPDEELVRAQALTARLAERVGAVREQTRQDGLDHELLDTLTMLLEQRARHCLSALQQP